jgi:hypothetical protein
MLAFDRNALLRVIYDAVVKPTAIVLTREHYEQYMLEMRKTYPMYGYGQQAICNGIPVLEASEYDPFSYVIEGSPDGPLIRAL